MGCSLHAAESLFLCRLTFCSEQNCLATQKFFGLLRVESLPARKGIYGKRAEITVREQRALSPCYRDTDSMTWSHFTAYPWPQEWHAWGNPKQKSWLCCGLKAKQRQRKQSLPKAGEHRSVKSESWSLPSQNWQSVGVMPWAHRATKSWCKAVLAECPLKWETREQSRKVVSRGDPECKLKGQCAGVWSQLGYLLVVTLGMLTVLFVHQLLQLWMEGTHNINNED